MATATLPLGVAALARGEPPRRRRSRFGEYDLIRPLARGGMGGVYLAVHAVRGESVALKVLDPQFASHAEVVERLFAEHALASRARHPGIVDIRGAYWADDGVPYLVMEYLSGQTLAAITDRARLDLASTLAICARAASALAALHAAGVIHCDVKHENLFVLDSTVDPAARWPRVKVIDFGVSRLVDEPVRAEPSVAGTPWCIAPEQWRAQPCTASDVYALGCLLYDLTTGHPPFDGSLPELMMAHLERRPSRPSWLAAMPIELERLILRALAKRPADRPAMSEMAVVLGAICEGVTARRAG